MQLCSLITLITHSTVSLNLYAYYLKLRTEESLLGLGQILLLSCPECTQSAAVCSSCSYLIVLIACTWCYMGVSVTFIRCYNQYSRQGLKLTSAKCQMRVDFAFGQ